MSAIRNIPYFLLFLGDITLLSVSLYITLFLRYGVVPAGDTLYNHFTAFSVLFVVWALIFFVSGLYDRTSLLLPDSLWQRILGIQAVNSLVAVIFFYTIPFFSIAPKTNLFIYLAVSSLLLIAWRYWSNSLLKKRQSSKVVMIASGEAAQSLRREIETGAYGIEIETHLDPDAYTAEELYLTTRQIINSFDISFIVLDRYHEVVQEALPRLHSFLYTDLHFLTIDGLYEAIFKRIPLERLKHEWFVDHIRRTPHAAYDLLKRAMDILIAGGLFLATLPLWPFIMLAMWLPDKKNVFYIHERVGRFGKPVNIIKFRTMTTLDSGDEALDSPGEVTAVGRFLRKTRLDELPQLLNVLDGDLSLIGPRPEIPAIAGEYETEISYYNARHLIKPGLSGWAQLWHKDPPKFKGETEKTREKLSYDLYYIKNRSLLLDIKIALWTLRVLASQSGR